MQNTFIKKSLWVLTLCLLFGNNVFAVETGTLSTETGASATETGTVLADTSTGTTAPVVNNPIPKSWKQTNWPQVHDAEAINNQQVRVIFNQDVLLSKKNPESVFTINPYNNQDVFLEVKTAEYEMSDKDLKTIILKTAEQQAGQNYIVTAGINLTDLDGNPVVSGLFDTGFFTGSEIAFEEELIQIPEEEIPELTEPETQTGTVVEASEPESTETDVIAPEEITDLMITKKLLELNNYLVTLSWKASLNTAGDLIDQILYKSLNRGRSYDKGTSLGANATKYETRLEGGKEYTFKITTKDRTGNESTGVIKSIRLPDTGPAGMALFGMLLSGLGARGILRKKK